MIRCRASPSPGGMPSTRRRIGPVEVVELRGLGLELVFVEDADDAAHRHRHRVGLTEGIVAEQCFEDWAGDEMLGDHRHGVVAGDAVVERGVQFGDELVERARGVGALSKDRCDAGLVAGGDLGDVSGPVLPVGARADLLDDLGVDRAGPLLVLEEPSLELAGRTVGSDQVDRDHLDRIIGAGAGFGGAQSDAVDVGVESFVVRRAAPVGLPIRRRSRCSGRVRSPGRARR